MKKTVKIDYDKQEIFMKKEMSEYKCLINGKKNY